MEKKKVICKRCRDKGLEGGCPKCGKKLGKIVVTKMQKTDGIVTDETTLAVIPEYYRGLEWDKTTLVNSHKELENRLNFTKYVNQLDKIKSIFASGSIPNKSVILIAPRKFSKEIWANNCIQLGMQNGYKMLPVMSSNVLKRALANMFDRPNAGVLQSLGYNLDDILTADCLFVSIDPGWQKANAYSLIDEVMTMRARFDRPTIFLSRFSIEELSANDYGKTFNSIINMDESANRLTYPAVIQYSEM